MQYKPHDYQQFAVDFIETHPQAAVLLECELGKTSITLTALNGMTYSLVLGSREQRLAALAESGPVSHQP